MAHCGGMRQEERIQHFVEEIWQWYARHKRKLPWRDLAIEDDTQRAYMILVSEVMLQQTQVPRVQIIFKQFIERFPTIRHLAKATNRDVLIAWRGMGYNSRALRLRDAASVIVDEWAGVFPKEMEALLTIKGIGLYTAAAIRNFAFNLSTPCIDTNIRRILHRTFIGPENPDGTWKKDDKYLLKLASEVLRVAIIVFDESSRRPSDWHAALMDFGSLIQTKSNPKWHLCPLTAAGIMKATPKNFPFPRPNGLCSGQAVSHSKEPGRFVGSKFIPNRIFRGKVVDLLRDHPQGLTLERLGEEICLDWSREQKPWLRGLLGGLRRDALVRRKKEKFVLS